jgi:hypothetical protein
MTTVARVLSTCACCLFVVHGVPAIAHPTPAAAAREPSETDLAEARKLHLEGSDLFKKGKIDAAYAKLTAAWGLVRNCAECVEWRHDRS